MTTTTPGLHELLRGDLIDPADGRYGEARTLYNGMIDKRPRMIARCADVADVISAVDHAREHDLLVAVRGGGHNAAGLGGCDDGLVIDLSGMRGARIDPDPAGAGAITDWARDYWRAVHPYTTRGGYVNFMMDEGHDRVRATYGANYERLVAVKRGYDPRNMFRVNQNIAVSRPKEDRS